jgi:hypothetical protein
MERMSRHLWKESTTYLIPVFQRKPPTERLVSRGQLLERQNLSTIASTNLRRKVPFIFRLPEVSPPGLLPDPGSKAVDLQDLLTRECIPEAGLDLGDCIGVQGLRERARIVCPDDDVSRLERRDAAMD